MDTKKFLLWKETARLWTSLNVTWPEVFILLQAIESFGGQGGLVVTKKTIEDLNKQFTPGELDTFIKLVCKINGLEHNEIKTRKTKPLVTVKEVKKTIEEVLSIKITLSNQQFKAI